MKTQWRPALVMAGVLVAAALVWGQVSTSSVTGVVQDKTGAIVPGAKVVAQNEGTGVGYETTTTSAGVYSIGSVPIGTYTITVTASGFQTFKSVHNVLTVGAPLVVDATLEVGAVTQVVQVESTYERVDTTSAMLSGMVSRREVVDLPLNGRNPLNLIMLEPGLVQRTNNAYGSGTHVFGSRDQAHNVTVDGIDANESSNVNPQNNLYRLNPDNVQEYRVVTHNATPEFGRNSGSNVTIATRAGTNEFHGDVYWFHRNTALNANEWFNNAAGIEKPVLLLHQFGADGGGPIVKNKTFFFASWQGNRIKQTMPIGAAFGIPYAYTNSMRSGLFRYFIPDPANPLVIGGVTVTRNSSLLVDPRTGELRPQVPLCGGTITKGCVATYDIFANDPMHIGQDPTIANLIGTIPLPNAFDIGDGLNFSGYQWNPASGFKGPHYMVRLDHKFDENNNIFGRMIWGYWDTTKGDFLNARPSVFPGFPPMGEAFRTGQNFALSYRRVFSPSLVNEFTTGFSRFQFLFPLREANQTGVEPPPYAQECFGDDSFQNVDMPWCNTPHTKRAVSNIQFIDNLSYVRGAHSLRTGFNIRLYRHNDERGVPGGFNSSPTIIFNRLRRSPLSESPAWVIPSSTVISSTDRNALQNAIVELMGIPGQVQQAFQADFATDTYAPLLFTLGTRVKQFNFYFQDEWKIRRNLTMTYGLRWEINLAPTDGGGRVFVPDKPIDGSQGLVTYVKADRWFGRNNLAALAPRISFAWDPSGTGKTAIRLGYGIAFDTISTFQVTSVGGKVAGSVLQCRVNVQDPAAASSCTDIPNNIRLTDLLNLPTFKPFTLGVPPIKPSTQFAPPNRPFLTAPNLGAFNPNLKVPTVHEWSLTIQRELLWAFVGQVGYIGKRGLRLFRAYDLNQIRTDQLGFLDSFMIARQNVLSGCRADGTSCPSGVTGVPPTLLLQLVSASTLNGYSSDLLLNGLGEVARRIDQTDITLRGFPANYFRANPQFSEAFYFDSNGDSNYHAMILQLRRRYEKGVTFGLSYTLGKAIDDMSVDPIGSTSGGGLSSTNERTPTDIRNFRLDRGRASFDNRHVLVINGLYDLPFGRGQKWGSGWPGFVNHLLGGWGATGIYTFQSGEPFSLESGVRTVNGYKVSRADVRGAMVPTALQFVEGAQGPVLWKVSDLITNPADPNFNCRQVVDTQSFFCIPLPGQYGIGRNTVQGPGFWNFDMGIIKKFSITERVKLDFRTEVFNVFNHPNFENPRNATEGAPRLTSSSFAQTCCVTASVPSSTTIIAIGEPNRVIQFALKVSF